MRLMLNVDRLTLSFVLSILAGGLSYWRGSLTRSGWAGAVAVGTITAGFGGWEWGLLVIVFFVTSSGLSRLGRLRKATLAADHWEKNDRRDWGQVLANGGLVAGLALLSWARPSAESWAPAVGVLATVTGDTWATEIGVLSRATPWLITTARRVPAGTSGGVTLLGSAASLAGAALIGCCAVLFGAWFGQGVALWILPAAIVGGIAGVAFDSLLGATVQAMRWCPRCQTETERRRHGCGAATTPLRGWSRLTNDVVNLLASAAGGLVALAVQLTSR